MDGEVIAGKLDHAFLRVDSSMDVESLRVAVENTLDYGLRSLCIPPVLAATVRRNYPSVRLSVAVAYPLGGETLSAKVFAVQQLVELGVPEVDVVYDLFALANSNWRKVEEEAHRLGRLTAEAGVFQKAIIETPILDQTQISRAAEILLESPVDCVKTSTGYARDGTNPDHVRLLRQVLSTRKWLKASGGIRTFSDARAMLDAGADILGTSHSVAIVEEARALSAQ
jgi:deoxyribose-phosphate aldolase